MISNPMFAVYTFHAEAHCFATSVNGMHCAVWYFVDYTSDK